MNTKRHLGTYHLTRQAAILLLAAMPLAAFIVVPVEKCVASTREDKMGMADYGPALREAVQSRLKELGLYAGPIDGVIGPATKAALSKLTGYGPNFFYQLQTDMVKRLWGIDGMGIYDEGDEVKLMQALGVVKFSQ